MPLSDISPSTMAAQEETSQLGRAEIVQREMVKRRTAELGPNNVSTLKAMLKLGETLKRRHAADVESMMEAKTLFTKVVAGYEAAFGAENERTLTVVNHLAGVMERIGRDDEAEALFRRALSGRENTLGKHHPDTIITVNNLALLLETKKGQTENGSEADQMYRRALPFTPRE